MTPTADNEGVSTSADAAIAGDVAIGTRNLTRKFGDLVAVDSVDLAVPAGELRAVIGPNGAGKTTLFDLLTGALSPTAGSVWFGGEEITDNPQHERPHLGLARSFQENELFTSQTVLENVRIVAQTEAQGAFSFALRSVGKRVAVDRATEILEHLQLADHRDTVASNLSHGDQRRLGIAMALATGPDVLLLDEPTSGIGPAETTEVADLIKRIQAQLDLTVILIEHDVDIVLSISDRITVLNRGSVIATGPPETIQEDSAVQDAYLSGVQGEL